MANAKNTIQNIPLTGLLNLNTLKTDVKQFQDYNEKNSTVFGGELSPLWKATTRVPYVNSPAHYPVYNSKGECFIIDGLNEYHLYKPSNRSELTDSDIIKHNGTTPWFTVPLFFKVNTKQDVNYIGFDAYGYKLFIIYNNRFYLCNDKYFILEHLFKHKVFDLTDTEHFSLISGQASGTYKMSIKMKERWVALFEDDAHHFNIYAYYSNAMVAKTIIPTSYNDKAFITLDGTSTKLYFISKGGKISSDESIPELWSMNYTSSYIDDPSRISAVNNVYEVPNSWLKYKVWVPNSQYKDTYVFAPYTASGCRTYKEDSYSGGVLVDKRAGMVNAWYKSYDPSISNNYTRKTGHDGNGYIPGYNLGWVGEFGSIHVYTLDGNIVSYTVGGLPIASPNSLSSFDICLSYNFGYTEYFSSFKCNNEWYAAIYCHPGLLEDFIARKYITIEEAMKNIILDNRYIIMPNTFNGAGSWIYDIEEEKYISDADRIGYINTAVPTYAPSDNGANRTFMSAAFMSGYNATFTKNNSKFISYLPQPLVMNHIEDNGTIEYTLNSISNEHMDTPDASLQFYLDYGNSILSPIYIGTNSLYAGAAYPRSTSGNALIPIGLSSKLISGFTNNDLIRNGDTVYPAFYWNNNVKIYGFYMFSSMSNIKGAFALQNQKYAFDDDVIYSLVIENGIISSSNVVCYKKNLRYIGSLPTKAIFYSDFNKSFYQFTGDAIISKMFEASDIVVKSAFQNPATFSIWITTDKGIYIISDTDMYRLDINPNAITFTKNEAIMYISRRVYLKPYQYYDESLQVNVSLYNFENEFAPNIVRKAEPIKLKTAYYGLGNEQKANYDCWYIRLHASNDTNGYIKYKVNTITDKSFFSDEVYKPLTKNDFDENGIAYIKAQPKYQSAVAMQLELETDIPIYQISLGINATDAVAQMSSLNF